MKITVLKSNAQQVRSLRIVISLYDIQSINAALFLQQLGVSLKCHGPNHAQALNQQTPQSRPPEAL